MFNKVAIIGVGLIGGSIALAIRKKKLAKEIVGVARHKKTLLLAKKIKAIDRGSMDLSIIKNSDLVILATPISSILNLSADISKLIGPDCIVSDVGSTKQEIVSKLGKIFPKYIGSHPLAGSERRGITCAHLEIFKNSLCILTPVKDSDVRALAKLKKLWGKLGARVIVLKPDAHDMILSFVSHLPHIVAFALIGVVPHKFLKFAATGLKDTTRIASSDSRLWCDIFLSNQKNILKSIDLLQHNINKLKSAVNIKDKTSLTMILKRSKQKRDLLA